MSEYWGYHSILDCGGCEASLMSDRATVDRWIRDLVVRIDMEPIGEPWIEYTAGHDIGKAGFTVVQVIVTSSITAHFIDNTGQIYLDVFSCKKFDSAVVKNSMEEFFGAKSFREYYLTRQAD